jgi:hypothetical protein
MQDWPQSSTWLHLFEFDASHPDLPSDATRQESQDAMMFVFARLYGLPRPFSRTTTLRVSRGGAGSGVTFCRHGFSWLAMLEGGKRWLFAPPNATRPQQEQECDGLLDGKADDSVPNEITHVCTQRPGEVMVVPTAWWHSVCNTASSFAFGGQDDCDTDHRMGSEIMSDIRQVECHGDTGSQRADNDPEGKNLRLGKVHRLQSRHKAFEQSTLSVRSVKPGWRETIDGLAWTRDRDEL